jgi:hypothetical protein
MLLTSRREWFAEGLPCEWLNALDDLQAVLTRAKQLARAAMEPAADAAPRQGALF